MRFRAIYSTTKVGGETVAKITKIEATSTGRVARKIRVAAYARVSTDSDEQLLSLKTQKEHYDSFIKSHPDWEYAGLYYDEGISGTKMDKRRGLLMMLHDCEEGKIDKVITKSISRLSRNTTDTLEMVRKLSKLGVYIFFEKENIDTEHMSSELMLSILSSIAESESRSISENSKWSIKHRFEEGTYIIATPPFGYANINGEMVLVPEEAEVVKWMFNQALQGNGCNLIARALNKKGIATKRGKQWHPSTVRDILRNEKYTGDCIFQKTYTDSNFTRHNNFGEENMYLCKNHHEAIISHEDFEKVGEAMTQRSFEKNINSEINDYQKRYAFSGRLYCGNCGSTFKRRKHYVKGGKYVAWCCNKHLADKAACSMLYVRDEAIKQAFLKMIKKLQIAQAQVLKPLITGLKGANNKERMQQVMELERKIENNVEQQKLLVNLMSSGYIEPDVYHADKNELLAEADALERKKHALAISINGDLVHQDEAQKLLRYVLKKKSLNEFDEDTFLEFVDSVTILTRSEFVFNLKCGLKLTERMRL